MNEETQLMVRRSLPEMARVFAVAANEMEAGLALIEGARDKLDAAFGNQNRYGSAFEVRDPHRGNSWMPEADDIRTQWKQAAWKILVDRMELKRICSVARAAEIDKQMNDPKNLPEITEENMLAMIEGNAKNLGAFLDEAVKELFDRLRPWRWGDDKDGYKTNKVYQIGEKVILAGYLSLGYGRGRFSVSYYGDRQQTLRCLDNVMHLLDGKGTIPTHAGPLVDAINSEENKGSFETEYFRGKCFGNCNLHLQFKRRDLLDRLNLAGSGLSHVLPGQEKKRG